MWSMLSPRWKVLAGMTLGALVGFLIARLVVPDRDTHRGAVHQGPESAEIVFESSRPDLPILSLGEDEFAETFPTIHAEAIDVGDETASTVVPTSPAGPPDTLPDPAQATPIDVHNQDAEKQLRAIIDEELAAVGEPDRDVWFDVLRGMTEQQARDILQIWKLTGGPRIPSAGSEALTLPSPAIPFPAATNSGASPHDAAICAKVGTNLANLHVPGYRRFDALQAQIGGACPLDLTPGEIVTTHNPLHLAIDGDGFFLLANANLAACSRCGCFDLNGRRELIQCHGGRDWALQPVLRIPEDATRFEVAEDGDVIAYTAGDDEGRSCGRIQLVDCINPQHLGRIGGSLLQPTLAAGTLQSLPPTQTHLLQSRLERSNATIDGEQRVLDLLDRRRELLQRLETPGPALSPVAQ
jgi:flagellar basal body rod protein FlgF